MVPCQSPQISAEHAKDRAKSPNCRSFSLPCMDWFANTFSEAFAEVDLRGTKEDFRSYVSESEVSWTRGLLFPKQRGSTPVNVNAPWSHEPKGWCCWNPSITRNGSKGQPFAVQPYLQSKYSNPTPVPIPRVEFELPTRHLFKLTLSVTMIEATFGGPEEESEMEDKDMGIRPPVIHMPGSPQNGIVIINMNFEISRLKLVMNRGTGQSQSWNSFRIINSDPVHNDRSTFKWLRFNGPIKSRILLVGAKLFVRDWMDKTIRLIQRIGRQNE